MWGYHFPIMPDMHLITNESRDICPWSSSLFRVRKSCSYRGLQSVRLVGTLVACMWGNFPDGPVVNTPCFQIKKLKQRSRTHRKKKLIWSSNKNTADQTPLTLPSLLSHSMTSRSTKEYTDAHLRASCPIPIGLQETEFFLFSQMKRVYRIPEVKPTLTAGSTRHGATWLADLESFCNFSLTLRVMLLCKKHF